MDPVRTLAANLKALMEHHKIESQGALGKLAGVSQSTVGRMLAGDHASQIDRVQKVAAAFELSAWQLLVPGLEPTNLPTYLTERERDLFQKWKSAAADLARLP